MNAENQTFTGSDGYISSAALSDAVNVALALERPLLLKGEPGTGKTVLAEHVATQLGLPLLTWHIKSSSKAQDGLYVYDTVQRLNDSRFGGGDVQNIRHYIKLGPLGESFAASSRQVLLIDEIDKADLEFPNDLLRELDEMQFTISETGDTIRADNRPFVLITSNNERELPDAFLRRCIFHYIDFPDREQMTDIIAVHHPNLEDTLLEQALVKFYWLRAQPEVRKKPSTSELIDWISAMKRGGIAVERLENELPFLGVLLKKEQDLYAVGRELQRRSPPTSWDQLGRRDRRG